MELTRERREARLRPLSLQGVVAVVTGFIGATGEGAPTTLWPFGGTGIGVYLATVVIVPADVRLTPQSSSSPSQ